MDRTLYRKIDKIFNPDSIAIIGASSRKGQFSNNSARRLSWWEKKDHVYCINPKLDTLYDHKCLASIKDVPEKVDLAYICVGAKHVPEAMQQCVDMGVESVLIHSSGFSEIGEEGKKLQAEVSRIAKSGGIRFLGPNCLGIYNHRTGMLVDNPDPQGGAAIVSHSGALTVLITKLGKERGIHFSKTASVGNQADINTVDLIEYLGEDPDTRLIFVYMEGVGDGKRFLEVLRKVTRKKPVLIWKGGRTSAGSRAATSHSAALAGDFQVFKSAAIQAGAILCDDMDELIDAGLACQNLPLPKGMNVAICTGPGGAGVAAADASDELGLACPQITGESREKLLSFLPSIGSAANPVDLTTVSADEPELFSKSMDVFTQDDNIHMSLMITAEVQNFIDEVLPKMKNWEKKPYAVNVLNLFYEPAKCVEVSKFLRDQGMAVYATPRQSIRALSHLAKYAAYIRKEERAANSQYTAPANAVETARQLVAQAREAGQQMLTERQAMDLFAAYGIPVVGHGLARSADEAVALVKEIGFPVVAKVSSPDVVHKTDAGGVYLNINDEQTLRQAFEQVTTKPLQSVPGARIEGALLEKMVKTQFELSAGMMRDPQFGPVVLFGLGGIFIEVLRDVIMGASPLTKEDALDMINGIRSKKILSGVRGMAPVDHNKLADILLALHQIAMDLPEILEIDINPLASTADGVVAVDARIKIGGAQ